MFQTLTPVRLAAVAASAVAGLALAACDRRVEPQSPDTPQIQAPAPPTVPLPPPAMGRSELLTAMDAAASDYGAGRAPEGQALAGRRFAIRQAFGCGAPSSLTADDTAGDGVGQWSWGSERRTVEIRLRPADWKDSGLIATAADLEAVEGFWLARPWVRGDGCSGPRIDPAADETDDPSLQVSPQTMGLAAVSASGGSRLGRRSGRAYGFTVRGSGDQLPAAPIGGYRLVLEGRFTTFSDGQAIHCFTKTPDQRPVCIAAAQLDRVAFETAQGAVLSEWRPG